MGLKQCPAAEVQLCPAISIQLLMVSGAFISAVTARAPICIYQDLLGKIITCSKETSTKFRAWDI